jgi:cytochrome bd-type quinol oxidase subunit 2
VYHTLLFYHSIVRWLAVVSLAYATYRAYKGYTLKTVFTKTDNTVRHWTATISHIQLFIGIILYSQSSIIKYFWINFKEASQNLDTTFFSLIHVTLMITAIVLITVGSALAKRKQEDNEKFKTMLTWFSISLTIIFIAIPWPFSPLASRPYLR